MCFFEEPKEEAKVEETTEAEGGEDEVRCGNKPKGPNDFQLSSEEKPGYLLYMRITLQGTNISPQKWHFEDDFPFPKVGYVNCLEGILSSYVGMFHKP